MQIDGSIPPGFLKIALQRLHFEFTDRVVEERTPAIQESSVGSRRWNSLGSVRLNMAPDSSVTRFDSGHPYGRLKWFQNHTPRATRLSQRRRPIQTFGRQSASAIACSPGSLMSQDMRLRLSREGLQADKDNHNLRHLRHGLTILSVGANKPR